MFNLYRSKFSHCRQERISMKEEIVHLFFFFIKTRVLLEDENKISFRKRYGIKLHKERFYFNLPLPNLDCKAYTGGLHSFARPTFVLSNIFGPQHCLLLEFF